MYKATEDILNFAHQIDNLKNKVFSKQHTVEEFAFVYKNDKIEALTLYWCFLNNFKDKAFDVELETIDNVIGKYSHYNAERLKAMTSILDTDKVFTNMFAFNTMVECFNGHEITAQTIIPYSAEEIAWTCINILGIWGADNFPFAGNVLKYIQACLIEDSWELPPMYLSFPVILNMFTTDELQHYVKVTNLLSGLHLKDIIDLGNDKKVIQELSKTPHLVNYLANNVAGAKYIIHKITDTGSELEDILL